MLVLACRWKRKGYDLKLFTAVNLPTNMLTSQCDFSHAVCYIHSISLIVNAGCFLLHKWTIFWLVIVHRLSILLTFDFIDKVQYTSCNEEQLLTALMCIWFTCWLWLLLVLLFFCEVFQSSYSVTYICCVSKKTGPLWLTRHNFFTSWQHSLIIFSIIFTSSQLIGLEPAAWFP